MDILDKAYDYIDYTLIELSKLEESCVSLLYFFKVFSPAGQLAQNILLENGFIEVETNRSLVVCITDRGREVLSMGGVREYFDHVDAQTKAQKDRIRKVRKMLTWAACMVGVVLVAGVALKR